jgi:lipopolysaccharide/colanic/teichoic acid biosynthesis glycosyltransferase
MNPTQKGIPRIVEVILAGCGLVILSPILALAAIMVALSSPGPVFYRQIRIGFKGKPFTLYKFRSLSVSQGGTEITVKGDTRITLTGRFLRKTKIDELPELWNVLKGDMALVGARPEVEKYVNRDNWLWREILRSRPGITDPVTMSLRNEEELLASVDGDRERFYVEKLQPVKLEGYVRYLRRRNAWLDVWVIFKTLYVIVMPRRTTRAERNVGKTEVGNRRSEGRKDRGQKSEGRSRRSGKVKDRKDRDQERQRAEIGKK